MPTSVFDAFQFVVAFYMFYVAIKGDGPFYNFPAIPKKKQESVRKTLRTIYAIGGCISLIDGAAALLRNRMFTVTYKDGEENIVQNFTIDSMPFITYNFLRMFSFGCSIAIVGLLIGILVYIKKVQNR